MTDAAFQGTFADFKIVKSRGVAQFTVETPLTSADAALAALGGVPRPDAEVWVAIARLVVKPAPDKPERSASQRAWALCQSMRFGEWIGETLSGNPEYVAETLRHKLGIKSRSELDTDPAARARFEQLEAEYKEASR